MPSHVTRTHQLECERFAESFRLVVEEVFDEVTHVIVHLHEEEQQMDPNGRECARVWEMAREQFHRTPSADDYDATAWMCELNNSTARCGLLQLINLTDGLAGQYFVYYLELRRDDTPVLDALPHHSDVGLDVTQLDNAVLARISERLSDHAACLVPIEPQIEWVSHERQWSISGFSLCKATLDERRTSCYELANLRRVRQGEDGTALTLDWDPGSISDDIIGRTLSLIAGRLYNPPQTLPCETPERATRVETTLREMLMQYDGRTV